jgi:hypothetical protein
MNENAPSEGSHEAPRPPKAEAASFGRDLSGLVGAAAVAEASETTAIVSRQEQPPLSDGMAFVRPPPPKF